jgi:hypothetical protein
MSETIQQYTQFDCCKEREMFPVDAGKWVLKAGHECIVAAPPADPAKEQKP